MKWLAGFLFLIVVAIPAQAQELHNNLREILRAEVTGIVSEREELILGTSASTTVQTITAEVTKGERSGESITFDNDLIPLSAGDKIFISHIVTINGDEYYYLQNIDRQGPLFVLIGLFVVLLIGFARWQGVRALLSLFLPWRHLKALALKSPWMFAYKPSGMTFTG